MALSLLIALACPDPVKPAAGRDSVEDDSGEVDSGETGDSGEPVVPCSDAPMVDVEVGGWAGCVRHADGCLDCWSNLPDTGEWAGSVSDAPEGPWSAVSIDGSCDADGECDPLETCHPQYAACGVGMGGELHCWGSLALDPPEGVFTSLAVGYQHACALDADGRASCWGETCEFGECSPPETVFQQVVSGQDFSCGLTLGGTVECWGLDESENCGCPEDESCWGLRNEYFTPWLAGPYDYLFAAGDVICGALGEEVTCVSYYRYAETPVAVALPAGYSPRLEMWGGAFLGLVCGVNDAGALDCEQVADVPDLAEGFDDAQVSDVDGGYGVCGITTDGRLICAYYAERLAWCPYCDEIWYPTE